MTLGCISRHGTSFSSLCALVQISSVAFDDDWEAPIRKEDSDSFIAVDAVSAALMLLGIVSEESVL